MYGYNMDGMEQEHKTIVKGKSIRQTDTTERLSTVSYTHAS